MIFILSSVDVFSSLRITSSANNYTVVLCSEYKHANYKPHPYFVTIHKPQHSNNNWNKNTTYRI